LRLGDELYLYYSGYDTRRAKFSVMTAPTFSIPWRAIADGGYQVVGTATAVKNAARVPLRVVKRSGKVRCFVVLTEPWIVERIFGWFGRWRRLAKDFESLARSHRHSSSCGNSPHDATHRTAQSGLVD
jgi:transposase